MTDTALDLTHVIDTHLDAYAEPDPQRRRTLVAEVWSTDGRLIDPPFDGTGHEEIAAMTDAVLAHYPGHTFTRTTAIDEHHGAARYGWALVGPDGDPAVTGVDVVDLDDEGRIVRVLGFFGELAPVPA